MDSRLYSPEDRTRSLESRINDLLEANRQKEKSNRTLQRQISKIQIELQESQFKPINKTTWRQLFTYFTGSVILGFGLSLGALGAFGWVKIMGRVVWG